MEARKTAPQVAKEESTVRQLRFERARAFVLSERKARKAHQQQQSAELVRAQREADARQVGLKRIVASHHRPSASYQLR
jgi:hypothetical protein